MNATKTAYPNRYAAYLNDRRLETYATRSAAELNLRIEAQEGDTTFVAERHVEIEPTTRGGGGYVALLVEEGGGRKPVAESNAYLICRFKGITAAERLGVPFRE